MDITETTPTRDSIEELIETIDELDDWSVDDWSLEAGADDTATVDLSAEWSPDDPPAPLQTLIKDLEAETESGPTMDDIQKAALKHLDINPNEAADRVQGMNLRGEVYSPDGDHFRTI